MDPTTTRVLYDKACQVRLHAYAPYSRYKVGAALRSTDADMIFMGCNVENAVYPEGTCAEAGAIAAMIAAGHHRIAELLVVADSTIPVPPCGGCRQKIVEFADQAVPIPMANLHGAYVIVSAADLLPVAFDASFFDRTSKGMD